MVLNGRFLTKQPYYWSDHRCTGKSKKQWTDEYAKTPET
jgi:hypothetical protein